MQETDSLFSLFHFSLSLSSMSQWSYMVSSSLSLQLIFFETRKKSFHGNMVTYKTKRIPLPPPLASRPRVLPMWETPQNTHTNKRRVVYDQKRNNFFSLFVGFVGCQNSHLCGFCVLFLFGLWSFFFFLLLFPCRVLFIYLFIWVQGFYSSHLCSYSHMLLVPMSPYVVPNSPRLLSCNLD